MNLAIRAYSGPNNDHQITCPFVFSSAHPSCSICSMWAWRSWRIRSNSSSGSLPVFPSFEGSITSSLLRAFTQALDQEGLARICPRGGAVVATGTGRDGGRVDCVRRPGLVGRAEDGWMTERISVYFTVTCHPGSRFNTKTVIQVMGILKIKIRRS